MQRVLFKAVLPITAIASVVLAITAAMGFLLAALYLAFRGGASAPVAAAATGGVALGAGILALLLAHLASRRACPKAPAKVGRNAELPIDELIRALGGRLAEQAGAVSAAHPWGAAAISLAVGFALGASPRLRITLLELLRH